ncbi:hypothetical protein, partial [Bacillus toyonensis]|uniref:hypothetical protein n=1 Tax=Bacillus toyonensis TaxID=155322 RepID=UPI002E24ECE9|nr:hypothetical protein [Bacillus toyonensis]
PSRYRFTACILSFEENLAIKNAPPIVNYVSNNWGALHYIRVFFESGWKIYKYLVEIINFSLSYHLNFCFL